jgi:hypothetical protein
MSIISALLYDNPGYRASRLEQTLDLPTPNLCVALIDMRAFEITQLEHPSKIRVSVCTMNEQRELDLYCCADLRTVGLMMPLPRNPGNQKSSLTSMLPV